MNLLKSLVTFALALSVANANTVCPGAPSTSYGGGMLGCVRPICIVAGGGLLPSPDPTKYFVCAGPSLNYEMSCAPGTCFSFQYQVCVHPRDWVDTCQRSEAITTEAPATTQAPTTLPEVPSTEAPTTTKAPETSPTTLPAVPSTEAPVTTPSTEAPSTAAPVTTEAPVTPSASTTEAPVTTVASTTLAPVTTEPAVPAASEPTRSVQICPGSDRTAVNYGPLDCGPFVCTTELYAANAKVPTPDPLYFYFCFNDKALGQERCPTGTCFDYGAQGCVDPSVWQNYCHGL